ncbi:MAG: hypothetical protein ACKVVP_20680 [Chloroflexota bacterium]
MSAIKKIAISLPESLHIAVEEQRRCRGQSRSEFYRVAVEAALREEQRRTEIERYVRGYTDMPEADEEKAWAELGRQRLAEVPWD